MFRLTPWSHGIWCLTDKENRHHQKTSIQNSIFAKTSLSLSAKKSSSVLTKLEMFRGVILPLPPDMLLLPSLLSLVITSFATKKCCHIPKFKGQFGFVPIASPCAMQILTKMSAFAKNTIMFWFWKKFPLLEKYWRTSNRCRAVAYWWCGWKRANIPPALFSIPVIALSHSRFCSLSDHSMIFL